jgi:DNA-binding beta-propeller fold protein YncE/mono/diheme cytochrome c family protein
MTSSRLALCQCFVLSLAVGVSAGCGASRSRSLGGIEATEACSGAVEAGVIRRIGAEALGSQVVLARLGSRTLGYVADADDSVIHTLDIDEGRELAVTELGGTPSQLLLGSNGQLYAALRDRGKVQILTPHEDPAQPLETKCTIAVPTEPVGLALTRDERLLLVTSGWGRSLTTFRTDTYRELRRVPLAREPRGVVVSDDGNKAFVSHAVGGTISIIDLNGKRGVRQLRIEWNRKQDPAQSSIPMVQTKPERRVGLQGFALAKSVFPAGRIFGPNVLVDPGEIERPASGYGDTPAPHVSSISVLDADAETILASSVNGSNAAFPAFALPARVSDCLLPRAAAVDPQTGALLVACMGVGAVVAYDAASAEPRRAELMRWDVASGPSGIAVDSDHRRAVVWSELDRTVNIIDLEQSAFAKQPPEVAFIAVARKARRDTGDIELGRTLFHTVSDMRISSDGRACASCHPDGRDDALTWATPGGPRQTALLAGRLAGTAPYGWDGAAHNLETHLGQTFQRLRGSGLRGRELVALVAYIRSLEMPRVEADVLPEALRGKQIFFSSASGCGACHAGGNLSDGALHDVKSRAKADSSGQFETPSLRGIGFSAPYFHDGRFESLEELLEKTHGTMGRSAHLSKQDRAALVAYLKSL